MDGHILSSDFFEKEFVRIETMVEPYISESEKIISNAAQLVNREEFASGGECLLKGYYCPNKIVDIVVGGVNRGKILKRITSLSKKDFWYGFDKNNRLLMIKSKAGATIEIISYVDNKEIGIGFSELTGNINFVSECIYENSKLKTYSVFHRNENNINRCERQDYYYENDKMLVDWYTYRNTKLKILKCLTEPHVQYFRYVFPICNGVIKKGTHFTSYEYSNEGLKEYTTIDGREFKVTNGQSYIINIDRTI